MKQTLLFFFLFAINCTYSQEVKGVISDDDGSTLVGVLVESSEGAKTRSDVDGAFAIQIKEYPVTLNFIFFDFENKKLTLESAPTKELKIKMIHESTELEGVVVSASRREQKIENVTVSLEIIKPELIENKGITTVEDAVNQAPGTYTMDGQVSIRGGSGFSYGAGSRVMVVWNDAPLISADAGDVKWESIALENISQIEVLKGASSVLYGSGALNGIVALRDKEPTRKGELKASYQFGVYDKPKRESLRWNDKALMSHQLSAYYGKMYDKFGFNVSAYGYKTDGYRAGEEKERVRLNGGFVFKPEKIKRMKVGVNYSLILEKKWSFLIWESDVYGYTPLDGLGDPHSDSSSLSLTNGFRAMVDPYVIWYDSHNNKHSLQTRYYNTTNRSNSNFSATGNVMYADYKFERSFGKEKDWILTAGLTGNWGIINADLYGDHHSQNYSLYGQLEKTFGRLRLTAGVRGEYYQANDLKADTRLYLSKDSTKSIPVRPIFRTGANYQVAEHTYLRASYGQAYRFPSIAERFASTSVGALNIFPNPDLKSEKGWSAELGVKQGFKIGNFKGYADLSGFINEYRNMMEFTFGYYQPDSIPISFNPADPGYPANWYGFRAENAEHARIIGAELSINGTGNIGPVEITALLGYTYMNPILVNPDSAYIYGTQKNGGLSNPESNMLKYRFKHLAKGDVQLKYKNFFLGFGGRYNSFMVNIDDSFENGVNTLAGQTQILKGLKEYREKNNKGDFVFDIRAGYQINKYLQVHFIINNLLNQEYVTRPGDIQPPREFVLRVQANF